MKRLLVAALCLLAMPALADEPASRGAVGTYVSGNNSTTAALGASATFVGKADDVTHYQEIDLNIAGAPSNAAGTLYFEFSPDGTNWDVSIPLSLTGPSLVPVPLRVILPFFRIRYVNGATPLTQLRLTTVYHTIGSTRLTRFLNQPMSNTEPIENTHSVVAGQVSNGVFQNAAITTAGPLSVTGSVTASGTVTGNQGAPNSLANGWPVKLTDGVFNLGTISHPVYVITSSGSITIAGGTVAVTQSGAWTVAATQSGNWDIRNITGTVSLPTGAATSANQTNGAQTSQIIDPGGVNKAAVTASSALKVDGSAVTQPVSGTVTANQGSPNTAANAWPSYQTDRFGTPLNQTAFGENRNALPFTLGDFVNKYELDPTFYSTSTTNGGTVVQSQQTASITMAVTGTNDSQARLRTNTFFRYQAGKALRYRMSIYHPDAGKANQVRRWGFFDDNDGLFYQLNGTALAIVQRSSVSGSVVETTIPQASWSIDKMDGSGPSGITLDVTKGNIYEMEIQWLGVGNIFCYIDGFLVHVIKNANANPTAYMKTAQLPLAQEVINTGASTASSMSMVCQTIMIFGGTSAPEFSYGAFNSADITVGATEIPLIAIRVASTYKGITNRELVVPHKIIVSTSGGRAGYRLLMNPTVTGGAWVAADGESGVEYNITATSFSGGQTLLRGFLPNSNDVAETDVNDLFAAEDDARKMRVNGFATGQDVVLITGEIETGGSTAMRGSISWTELK